MAAVENAFTRKNELMRMESLEGLHPTVEAPLMAFFWRIGLPHVYWEYLVPVMRETNAFVVMAVKDRAWPPWGVGAHTIHALMVASPVSEVSAGLSHVFVLDEDIGNIGLIAATYKEMLDSLVRRSVKEINYVVLDGSVLASRILSNVGFEKTEELFLTQNRRYNLHSASPSGHLEKMGLAEAAVPDLLEGTLDDHAFSMVSQWIAATSASSPFWTERNGVPDVIPNTGGFLHASQPGGVPIRRRPEERGEV
jgi:hypothetical protein